MEKLATLAAFGAGWGSGMVGVMGWASRLNRYHLRARELTTIRLMAFNRPMAPIHGL